MHDTVSLAKIWHEHTNREYIEIDLGLIPINQSHA